MLSREFRNLEIETLSEIAKFLMFRSDILVHSVMVDYIGLTAENKEGRFRYSVDLPNADQLHAFFTSCRHKRCVSVEKLVLETPFFNVHELDKMSRELCL